MVVTPTVSESEARALFTGRRLLPIGLRRSGVPPTRIELIYLPYYYFDLTLTRGTASNRVRVAVDGLLGDAVLFLGDNLAMELDRAFERCAFRLTPETAGERALREYRWTVIEHRLRTNGSALIRQVSPAQRMYYPFWVAYFRRRSRYDFRAVDAVSGENHGVKLRRVILSALRCMS